MTKSEIIDYMYDNNVRGDYSIEQMADDLAEQTEPQTEEHCETCKHKDECDDATYEYRNTEWWCLGYVPIEDEPQTESPCNTCQEFDCYGCEHKQTERSE